MPADAPRATADDRLASDGANREAAASDAPPFPRPTNGNGGGHTAAPAGGSTSATTSGPSTETDDDGGFAALVAEVEGRSPLDVPGSSGASGVSVSHANGAGPATAGGFGGNGGGFPDPDPALRLTNPGPAPQLRDRSGDGDGTTLVGDTATVPSAPGLDQGPEFGPPGPDGVEPAVAEPRQRTRRPRGRGREGRRIRQRLWSIDPWSVFKISVMFYACMFVVVMVAGTVLWNVGRSSGVIDEFEGFVTQLGAYGECVPEEEVAAGTEFVSDDDCPDATVRVDSFVLDDGVVFKSALIAGIVIAITGSAANVLMTVLLNLITEVSGGMKYTIIREPTGPKRRRGLGKRLSGALPSAEKR